MIILTEQQRLEALAICDRIQELNAKLQADFAKLQETVERLAPSKPEQPR